MPGGEPNADCKRLKIRFFAGAADAVGQAALDVELGPDTATIGDLVAWLTRRHPDFSRVARRLLAASNLKYARPDTPLADGDEIAFFPPVSGG